MSKRRYPPEGWWEDSLASLLLAGSLSLNNSTRTSSHIVPLNPTPLQPPLVVNPTNTSSSSEQLLVSLLLEQQVQQQARARAVTSAAALLQAQLLSAAASENMFRLQMSLQHQQRQQPQQQQSNNNNKTDEHEARWWSLFEVAANVHPYSMGKRTGKKRRFTLINKSAMSLPALAPTSITPQWSAKDFIITEKLGQGHFGQIFRAYSSSIVATSDICTSTSSSTGMGNGVVALKRFCKTRILEAKDRGSRILELLQREVNIHSHLDHPNIVAFFGYYDDPTHVSLVLEFAPAGDLLRHMSRFTGHAERLERTQLYLRQVTSAVSYLQLLQVAHRDIKPENIVVTCDDTVKLCDFGWAVWYQKGGHHRQTTLCGTPEYVPPEMLTSSSLFHPSHISYEAEHVDPWALGVLAFELLYGDTPFTLSNSETGHVQRSSKENSKLIFEKIRAFKGFDVASPWSSNQVLLQSFPTCSSSSSNFTPDRTGRNEELKLMDRHYANLVANLMQVEPTKRLGAVEAMEHPFFRCISSQKQQQLCHAKIVEAFLGASSPTSTLDTTAWLEMAAQPTVAQRIQLFQNIQRSRVIR